MRGADYAHRAAQLAMAAYAPEEALARYRTVVGLTGEDDPRDSETLLGMGDAATLAGAGGAVRRQGGASLQYEQSGDLIARPGRARLGRVWWQREAVPQAREALEGPCACSTDSRSAETVCALVDLKQPAAALMSQHQYTAALAYVRRAFTMAEREKEDNLLASARCALGNLLARVNQLPEGLDLLRRALDSRGFSGL